jgi:hypothetical protein
MTPIMLWVAFVAMVLGTFSLMIREADVFDHDAIENNGVLDTLDTLDKETRE